jgi:uncharacterized cupredoxin-like copper-binding protein
VRFPRRLLPAAVAAGALAVIGWGPVAAGPGASSSGLAPERTVHLDAHYSHFSLQHITLRRGTVLHFVVRNDDPIDHELIVGDQALQDRHERGTEARHAPRPGEISVPAGTTGDTELMMATPGTYVFACHIPGHLAYGMHGVVTVK